MQPPIPMIVVGKITRNDVFLEIFSQVSQKSTHILLTGAVYNCFSS